MHKREPVCNSAHCAVIYLSSHVNGALGAVAKRLAYWANSRTVQVFIQ